MPFQFFADAALTTPLTELLTTELTDGSTSPAIRQVWFGSTDARRCAPSR